MGEESFQERTEQATPRRREKAREEGKVTKSMELNSAAIILLGFTAIYALGPSLAGQAKQLMLYTMSNAPSIASSDVTFHKMFTDSMVNFFSMMLPLFAIMIIIALGVNIAQVGLKVSSKAIEPKLDKLDVIAGLKKLFSTKSLVHLIRDTIKLVVFGIVAYYAIRGEFESFFLLIDKPISEIARTMAVLSLQVALKIGGMILIIGIIDYFFQKYELEKSIRMTKQEIKEEYKDTEGSPQIKSRIKQLQREMSRSRMMEAVPMADVVVTNPTHIAVALKYDQEEMNAPFVVAKGERMIAQKIKEIALKHGIPVIEDKPLARALFKMCDLGQMVPMNLYRAIAEVMAYVYKLKGKVMK